MWQRLSIVFVVGCGSVFGGGIQPFLINGRNVPASDFKEVVKLSTSTGFCTATIVGSHVIVTAAHCGKDGDIAKFSYEGVDYKATLTRSPLYPKEDHDLALGLVTEEIEKVSPVSIGGKAKVGSELTLMGYGCTEPIKEKQDPQDEDEDKQDQDPDQEEDQDDPWWWWSAAVSVLRQGETKVVKMSEFDMVSKMAGGSALCYGDSGGPAFVKSGSEYQLLGVNSKGNIKDTNYNLRLDLKESQEFLSDFAKSNKVEICGVTKTCS